MSSLAAIDVGSNAIRIGIAYTDQRGAHKLIEEIREPIRLGDDVFKTGIIPQATIQRSVVAFKRFQQYINKYQVEKIRAVATSAMREAKNSDQFRQAIEYETGIKIEIISGEEEARLIFQAVKSTCNLKGKLALLVDIGGGSVEITIARDSRILISESLKMGTVRLLQLLDGRKHGQKIFERLARAYFAGLKRRIAKDLRGRKIELCIGTGGNFEQLADLRSSIAGKSGVKELFLKDLDKIVKRLSETTFEQRVSELNMRPDRADVIVPAAIMAQEILRYSGIKRFLIPHIGLKNGVLLDLAVSSKKKSPESFRTNIISYCTELGRRLNFDEAHANTVAHWSLHLFRTLKLTHRLSVEHRILLEIAALLHDVGHCINSNGHHKHSAYIINASPFIGITERQKKLVACIARFHRKGFPNNDHPDFNELKQEERDVVLKLTSILRMADALDSSHQRAVKSIKFIKSKNNFYVTLNGNGDMLLEKWSLAKKSDFFEKLFDLKLCIKGI